MAAGPALGGPTVHRPAVRRPARRVDGQVGVLAVHDDVGGVLASRRIMGVHMSYTWVEGETVTVTIRLTKDEEARLTALAGRTGRTKSFYLRTALREYLDDLEDVFAADSAVREFEASGRKAIALSEVVADLGITDDELSHARDELRASGDL